MFIFVIKYISMDYELIEDLVSIIVNTIPTEQELNYFKEKYINPEIKVLYSCYLFRKAVDYNKFIIADFIIEQGYEMTSKIDEEFINHFINQDTVKLKYLLSKGYEINDLTNIALTSAASKYADVNYYNREIKPLLIRQKINKIKRNLS